MKQVRDLIIVTGDQLDRNAPVFDGFDRDRDAVWMAEVPRESTKVWSHKARIALFLSAMRHFRDDLRCRGVRVMYSELEDGDNSSLGNQLRTDLRNVSPRAVRFVKPGEWEVQRELESVLDEEEIDYSVREDRHFFCSLDEFEEHAADRERLVMEYFYREQRRRHDVLMDGDEPVGGHWNYDEENRKSFPSDGPGDLPEPTSFPPDDVTEEVLSLVEERFPNHPGSLRQFDWPVTPGQAETALDDFLDHRLPNFGPYQDAMWAFSREEEVSPYLYHSRLSAAMNLKLLSPRTVVHRAEEALNRPEVSLPSVEGFVRQVLGWREFVRGVYWTEMPGYLDRNELDAERDLPEFYWTGRTDMNCLSETIGQTLEYGYAHHIQRLMVTGLFAMLYGVDPRLVHEWYLAVYVDAVEWVELPNTLGMSQFGDGGVMATKPYAASGNYIDRMSNYCDGCKYDPGEATGNEACPFTTLYWDFLDRHEERLSDNHRMNFQMANLAKKSEEVLEEIRKRARQLRDRYS